MYLDPIQFMEAWELENIRERDLANILKRRSLGLKVCMKIPVPMPCYSQEGCVYLSAKGCILPRARRPLECLIMIPSVETIIEEEIKCSIPPTFSYLRAFSKWEKFYRERGLWTMAQQLAFSFRPNMEA
jgi:hypothetical protein